MVTTGDHDRVVPAHSFKLLASLQENKQEITLHICIDVKAGTELENQFRLPGKRGYSSLHTVQYGLKHCQSRIRIYAESFQYLVQELVPLYAVF
jgi:hypothetical protein